MFSIHPIRLTLARIFRRNACPESRAATSPYIRLEVSTDQDMPPDMTLLLRLHHFSSLFLVLQNSAPSSTGTFQHSHGFLYHNDIYKKLRQAYRAVKQSTTTSSAFDKMSNAHLKGIRLSALYLQSVMRNGVCFTKLPIGRTACLRKA